MAQFQFDNRFFNQLPTDKVEKNTIRQVFAACHSKVTPRPTSHPKFICWSDTLTDELGIKLTKDNTRYWESVLSGNTLMEGMQSYAMCYGGHQFGNWAGQLGDGRAINLGELLTPQGHRTLQLKGAGVTPYSRHADGLAVMRSSIREYLCSEAMHYLAVPTTRALSLVATGDQVERDMFYDGNLKMEQGAIVCRVAPSFIRFGNFEIFSSRQDKSSLTAIADFCIQYDYPELDRRSPTVYLDWFQAICRRTLEMIVHWQRVGFVHGVMNTDNMSILGLTIDYGPYGWLEAYDPSWTPNTTDLPGRRYAFANQPQVAHWNLYKLAEAISPLIGDTESLQTILNEYPQAYQTQEQAMQLAKLGIVKQDAMNKASDNALVEELQGLLHKLEIDMSLFYRALANTHANSSIEDLLQFSYQSAHAKDLTESLAEWFSQYHKRLAQQAIPQAARKQQMNQVNPWFVLRNFLTQAAIEDVEKGDYQKLTMLQRALIDPYKESQEFQHLVTMRPDWALNKAGCSMLSCSS